MPFKDPAKRREYERRWRATPKGQEARRKHRLRYKTARAYRIAYNTGKLALGKRQLRAKIKQLKLERGCADCGYAEHPAALQFDHVRGAKVADISTLVQASAPWSALLAEMEKCEVRCANCHAIRTAERAAGRKSTPLVTSEEPPPTLFD